MFEGFDFTLYDSNGQNVRADLGQLHRMETYTQSFTNVTRSMDGLNQMIKDLKDFKNGNVDRSLENF